MWTDSEMNDTSISKHLIALAGLGLFLCGMQVGWLVVAGDENSARYSLSFASMVLSLPIGSGELALQGMGFCAGFAWLALSGIACAALVFPVASEMRVLQRMLLAALLLPSAGWQLLSLSLYLDRGSASPLVIPLFCILLLCGFLLLRSRRSSMRSRTWTLTATLVTVLVVCSLLIGIRISGLLSGRTEELTRTVLVLLLSFAIVGAALRLRQLAWQEERPAWSAAYLFQLWLQTVWVPVPAIFSDWY